MSGTIKSLLFFTFLTSFSRDMYGVIFNLFLRESGIGNTFIGTITSLSLWGSAVLGLIISVYADAKGRKVALIISTAGYIFTGFYMIFIKDETQLLLFSFLRGGFGVSNFTVIVAMIVDATTPKNRAKVFGANFGISMGSGVFGNFVGGFFGDHLGFQWTLVISMVIFSLSMFILFPLKVERKINPIRKVFDFSSFTKRQKQIVAFNYLSTISVGFGAGLFIHFGNLIFKDLFDLSPTMIGVALSIAQIGTAGGSMVTHKLGKRFGPMEFCLVMQILVVPLMISLAFVREAVIFTILYAFRFVLMNTTSPVTTSIVNSYIPASKISTISGINSLLNNTIRAVAAMAFGFIVGKSVSGYQSLFIISTVFYGINALVYFFFFRSFRKDPIVRELYR